MVYFFSLVNFLTDSFFDSEKKTLDLKERQRIVFQRFPIPILMQKKKHENSLSKRYLICKDNGHDSYFSY